MSLGLLIILFNSPYSYTNSSGAPAGHTGSGGDGQMTCLSCHGTNSLSFAISPSLDISSGIEEYYVPGELTYFTISVTGVGVEEFGFQACFENEQDEKVGEIILVDSAQTQLLSGGTYITHTAFGTTGIGAKTWGFYWQAPPTLEGEITLHVSALLSNNNGVNTGDKVLFTSQSYAQPTLGCLDEDALNFNEQANTDDQSCFYSVSSASPLSITYDSLTIYGSTSDEELEVVFNVHNNSDSDLEVYVLRNILTEDVPMNWFCWDVCFLPSTDVSPFGIVIPSGSYTNEFSGHLVPNMYGGAYDIEYCFYSEMDFSDSICATIHYVVDGDIPGCMDSNALNYDAAANVDNGSCVLYPQPNWDFSGTTGVTHSIAITGDTDIQIGGESISVGDWIGVFYESEEGLVCAGYVEWEGENANVIVSGYDSISDVGFVQGEAFLWQIWDASTGVSWPMEVLYSSNLPNQAWFVANGQSALIFMNNMNPITEQVIDLPEGWSMFSSYMITEDMDIMTVLEPIVDHLIIVKNNDGNAYLVQYQFNALGDLVPGQGYLIKTNQATSLTIDGAFAKPEIHPIALQEGWNMVGYLKEEPELVEVVFEDLVNQDIIQIVKDYQGDVYIPQWYFNGIGDMLPGKGYQVKTFQESILQY